MNRGLAVWLGVAAIGTVAGAVLLYPWEGFGARSQPTALERAIARQAVRWSIPASMKSARNPVVLSTEVLNESRAHFADHCATCHANDGSGMTEMGQNFYPKAPDMRLPATQDRTDGELYWIIENGIRLTGMPAWGPGGGNDQDTWKLVHFIRHLKALTQADLDLMKSLNPKTPSEIEEEHADDQFLSGKDVPDEPAGHHH